MLDLQVHMEDLEDVEQLALVLMQTLDLHVEQGVGVHHHAVALQDQVGQAFFVVQLDVLELLEHRRVVVVLHQLFQLGAVLGEAVPDQLLEQGGQLGVGLAQPAAVGDAVGDVAEVVRLHLVVVPEDGVGQDLRVELGHAVHLVAGGQAQVGHADLVLADYRHILNLAHVAAIVAVQVHPQAAVDLLDDLEHPGQQLFKQLHVPALQRLAHDGVVGVGQGAAGDVPRLIPVVIVLIHQQAHQLGHAQGGMGVVDVDGHLVGQVVQAPVLPQVLSQNGLHRGGHQQILLAQAQPLALGVVVGGVEHLGNDLRHGVPLQGLGVIAPGEGGHIEALGGLGGPQHQGVDGLAVIPGNIHLVGHRHDGLVVQVGGPEAAVVLPGVDVSAEAHLHRLALVGHQPHVAHAQPVVGELHLPAVHDLLLEDAELIADGIARHGQIQAGGGVHVAGGQTAQAAVAQTRVGLDLVQVVDIHAALVQGLGEHVLQPQVVKVVPQGGAHQKLHGHIVDLLALVLAVELRALAGQHPVHHIAQGPVHLLGRSGGHGAAVPHQQHLVHLLDNLFLIHMLICSLLNRPGAGN